MIFSSRLKKLSLVSALIVIGFIVFRNQTIAQSASNKSYIMQGGEIEQKTLINPIESPSKPSDKNSEKTSNIYFGENYQVISESNQEDSQALSFSISNNLVDYGKLTPANPVSRIIDLTVSESPSRGYSVFTFENNELSDAHNNFIPDTTCDNGTCSEISSALWSSNLSFGFGYRCENTDGSGCTEDFSEKGYFKQFANESKSEAYQIIINDLNSRKAKIELKANISNTQTKSSYSNSIIFIAVPNL